MELWASIKGIKGSGIEWRRNFDRTIETHLVLSKACLIESAQSPNTASVGIQLSKGHRVINQVARIKWMWSIWQNSSI
ncbi:unnamed protein product [Linum tenue]|uniref:Uncharacterized protein n=1 Tax=Linum tenue TaxID=586396 RepID=A0AAV0MCH2_9ROSI|nr:unnamed protein product [Linum tenue]